MQWLRRVLERDDIFCVYRGMEASFVKVPFDPTHLPQLDLAGFLA